MASSDEDILEEHESNEVSDTEEGLWRQYTFVGQPMEPNWRWRHKLRLETTVPIVVLGDISEQPAEHYLTPGQPSQVILASPANVVFQPASPAITEEPLGPSLTPPRSDDSFDPYWRWRMFYDYTTTPFYEGPYRTKGFLFIDCSQILQDIQRSLKDFQLWLRSLSISKDLQRFREVRVFPLANEVEILEDLQRSR
ncbi:hypothetical protein B0H14DRAFT_2600022 [Mycena olivaceomarginata]|nr:hypothetical protein B0H14DRAFT_2600022 [Mycena olivaceomarginata]